MKATSRPLKLTPYTDTEPWVESGLSWWALGSLCSFLASDFSLLWWWITAETLFLSWSPISPTTNTWTLCIKRPRLHCRREIQDGTATEMLKSKLSKYVGYKEQTFLISALLIEHSNKSGTDRHFLFSFSTKIKDNPCMFYALTSMLSKSLF